MSNQRAVERTRREKDEFFRSNPHSPLNDKQQAAFAGLRYFDYVPELVFDVEVDLIQDANIAQIITTANEIRNYVRYGTFTFMHNGRTAQLTIYSTQHGYFLPFVDAAEETYHVGRYLDLEADASGRFRIDFNCAYNPFCAYSTAYSCPITPAENRLTIEIRAGEKRPPDSWASLA